MNDSEFDNNTELLSKESESPLNYKEKHEEEINQSDLIIKRSDKSLLSDDKSIISNI